MLWQAPAAVGSPLICHLGAVTVNTPLIDVSETWNNAAVTFFAHDMQITGTAYNAASFAFRYRFDGLDAFKIAPKGMISIGSRANSIVDPTILMTRNMNDGGVTNAHGLTDNNLFRRTALAYASLDVATSMQGPSMDHFVGVQIRAAYQASSGASVLNNFWGIYCEPVLDAGVITELDHVHIRKPLITGGGSIVTQNGILIDDLTGSSANTRAIKTAGSTPSEFGGPITVEGVPIVGPSIIPSGRWTMFEEISLAAGATGLTISDTLRGYPVRIRRNCTISQIKVHLTAAAAGGNFRFAIYNSSGTTLAPNGNALYTSGNISTTALGDIGPTGVNLAVSAGQVIWIFINADALANSGGAVTLCCDPSSSAYNQIFGSTNAFDTTAADEFPQGASRSPVTFGVWPAMTGNFSGNGFVDVETVSIPAFSILIA